MKNINEVDFSVKYMLPLACLNTESAGDIVMYYNSYSTSNINDGTIIGEELCQFYPNTPVVYIRWIENINEDSRGKGIGSRQLDTILKRLTNLGIIILAEPGWLDCKGNDDTHLIYNAINKLDEKDIVNQMYFLENAGFKNTEYKSGFDNDVFIYRSDLVKDYIKMLISNEFYIKE